MPPIGRRPAPLVHAKRALVVRPRNPARAVGPPPERSAIAGSASARAIAAPAPPIAHGASSPVTSVSMISGSPPPGPTVRFPSTSLRADGAPLLPRAHLATRDARVVCRNRCGNRGGVRIANPERRASARPLPVAFLAQSRGGRPVTAPALPHERTKFTGSCAEGAATCTRAARLRAPSPAGLAGGRGEARERSTPLGIPRSLPSIPSRPSAATASRSDDRARRPYFHACPSSAGSVSRRRLVTTTRYQCRA